MTFETFEISQPDPSCKGSITRWVGDVNGKQQQVLFATNPASTTLRVNQTVYASTNNGKSFDIKFRIDTSGGYGAINVNNANQLVVFYDYFPAQNSTTGKSIPGTSWPGRPGGTSFKLAVVDPAAMLSMDATSQGSD